jgi:MFS family permease
MAMGGRYKQRPAVSPALSPFRHRVFRLLWIATVVANIGGWMYSAAAGWLMATLNADPLMVSLVQAASSLPMFLLALPAGALADIIDKRRFVVLLEILITIVSVLFASLISARLVIPVTLLLFVFLNSSLTALEAPAWQSIVPQLVPKEHLAAAVAANSVGVNISRALGPALAGVIIVGFGIAAPFWIDAFSNLGVVGVLSWWRPKAQHKRALPAEKFRSAIRAGLRYARYNTHLRATLLRSMGFFLFASAYWALLPLVARNQLQGGPELYGILLGGIGAGAVVLAFFLPGLNSKFGANGLVVLGEAGTALTLALFGAARGPLTAVLASLIAGASWITVLANLNVSAQVALPEWVRGRGLAMYVMVFFGAMSIGSVVWGAIAGVAGLQLTHFIAASGALVTIPLTRRWKLQTGAQIDLTPSMHWPDPIVTGLVEEDAGPVMVSIEYLIEPKDRDPFLRAIDRLAGERKRDGAYAWGIFEDTANRRRFVETFLVESWAEHLRQHQRVTNADRVLQDHLHRYLSEKPKITHMIAAEPGRGLPSSVPN